MPIKRAVSTLLPNVRRDMVVSYPRSALTGLRDRRHFESVEAFCLFVGYPRSGHSLVGSLLSAHPDIVISHELDVLRFVAAGYRRSQLFSMILQKDRGFSANGRESVGYSYDVEGQWQGDFRRLRVIGDKKGGYSTWRLRDDPSLLERLREAVGVPLRIVHIVRNPYDNITTMASRDGTGLEEAMDRYFTLAATVADLSNRTGPDLVDMTHEEFVEDPAGCLERLCGFLGVDAPKDYLDDCAAIVSPSTRRTRERGRSTPELIEQVAGRMEPFPFFAGYSWDR